MVPKVGVALKVQDPYVPGFPFPLMSVTVTRRLGTLFIVVGWNWTLAVLTLALSAPAVPVAKHTTADAARPSVERTRFFVGLEGFTVRVLSAVVVPPHLVPSG